MAGTSWPTLTAGQKAKASDVEAKFDWIEGNLMPMTGGNQTNGVYDLGSNTYNWRSGYFSSNFFIGGNLGIGLTTALTKLHVNGELRAQNGSDTNASQIQFSMGFGNNYLHKIKTTHSVTPSSNSVQFFVANTSTSDDVGPVIKILADTASGRFALASGASVNQFSTDGTFSDNSDNIIPTQKAVKTYVDGELNATGTASGGTTSSGTLTASITKNVPGTRVRVVAQAAIQYTSVFAPGPGTNIAAVRMIIVRDTTTGSVPGNFAYAQQEWRGDSTSGDVAIDTLMVEFLDSVTSGNHTYSMYIDPGSGTATATSYSLIVG